MYRIQNKISLCMLFTHVLVITEIEKDNARNKQDF